MLRAVHRPLSLAGALALALYTAAGVVAAVAALAPPALRLGPRGRRAASPAAAEPPGAPAVPATQAPAR